MKKKKDLNKRPLKEQMKNQWKENKWLFLTYFILRAIVVLIMIAQFFNRNFQNVFMCILTLILLMIPTIVERGMHIEVPDTLEIIILLFIFAAEILGEIREYYLAYPFWDTMLHTVNGFLMAAIGFSLINILNEKNKAFQLSPLFVALVAFCFSMTIGVVWEFFEYGMDTFFKTDMQKDTIITAINSIVFNPDGKNQAVYLPIEEIIVNGVKWDYGGYIDIGLIDTMNDLLVNFIGASVFSALGYFYIKRKKHGKFINHFVPTAMTEEQIIKKRMLTEVIEPEGGKNEGDGNPAEKNL